MSYLIISSLGQTVIWYLVVEVLVEEGADGGGAEDAADLEHGGEHAGVGLGVAEMLEQEEGQPHVHGVADRLQAEHGDGDLLVYVS